MKYTPLVLALAAAALGGCALHHPPATVHTAAVESRLQQAGEQTRTARALAQRVGSGIAAARRNDERIDGKATVIMDFIDHLEGGAQ